MDIKDKMIEGLKNFLDIYRWGMGEIVSYTGGYLPEHNGVHVKKEFFIENFPEYEQAHIYQDGETVEISARYKETKFYTLVNMQEFKQLTAARQSEVA